jgi:hydroxyacylglutathione hydrolase
LLLEKVKEDQMFLEVVRSTGLAHLSYILGDAGSAAVIDPRRDHDIYLSIAARENARISYIFETHRNEDYVVGSIDLAAASGAEIFHGEQMAFAYGNPASDGDDFELGDIRLSVLHTPGHTLESFSIVMYDAAFSRERAVAVFSGDALFVGEVGRTDFYPGREEEMAGLLYDSIHAKLLPLGDEVMLYPGHGQGSICGGNLASRESSTLGYEKRNNPALRFASRSDFIAQKSDEKLFMPSYFQRVHAMNQEGPPPLQALPTPLPHNPAAFSDLDDDAAVLDVRSKEAFAGAHIPGSYSIPLDRVASHAAWFVDQGVPVLLVVNTPDEVETVVRYLVRLGYDDIPAYLAGGMFKWEVSGRDFDVLPAVSAGELVRRLDEEEDFILLDVRAPDEFENGHLPTAVNVHLGELPGRLGEIPRHGRIVTFCGSGERATIASSLLRMNGYERVETCFGSMAACNALGCPIIH